MYNHTYTSLDSFVDYIKQLNIPHGTNILLMTLPKKPLKFQEISTDLKYSTGPTNTDLLKIITEEQNKNSKIEQIIISQSRLALIGEMLSMVAHQWRQPLSLMSMIVNKLRLIQMVNPNKDPSYVYDLTVIEENIKYLSHTIEDFRSFFKPENEKTLVTPSEICNKLETLILPIIKDSNISWRVMIQDNISLYVYNNELIQVLLAIVNNAVDILKLSSIPNAGISILGEIDQHQENYFFKIIDNGGGIAAHMINKIFEPYVTTKGVNGTGLGLFMAYTIIAQHFNGEILVENIQEGAVFTVKFPISNK